MRRLAHRPPRELASVVARDVSWRLATRLEELKLAAAARTGRRVVVGPFVGEIGYELLYWIPFLRKALRRHGIPPSRVTAFARGGAAVWYRDVVDDALEVFALMDPEEFVSRLTAQREAARDAKLLHVGALERELVCRARVEHAVVVHPRLMYGRFRWTWAGAATLEPVLDRLDQRPLVPPGRLPDAVAHALPETFVAVKAYFSDVLPESGANREALRRVLTRLADRTDVVLLTTGHILDDHVEWAANDPRIHDLAGLLDPVDNLAVQTEVIARSRGLVSTYGGPSYIGALLGVPTLALAATGAHNPVHLATLRATVATPYQLVDLGDSTAAERFLAELGL